MQHFQATGTPAGGYSADTEILTRAGWKPFAKLSDDDEIATRNRAGFFEWESPIKCDSWQHAGYVVEFANRYTDLLVALGQPILVRRPASYLRKQKSQDGKDWHTRPAQYFADHPQAAWETPATSSWLGAGPTQFYLPDEDNGRGIRPGVRMPITVFCAFLGTFLSEGCVHDRNAASAGRRRDVVIEVAQAPASQRLSEIGEILAVTGMNWKYRTDGTNGRFWCSSAVLGRWLKESCGHGSWNKRIPGWVKDLPVPCLERLLHGMMLGDGHWKASGLRAYATSSERLADDAQEIFQKLGVDAGKHAHEGKEHWKSVRARTAYKVEERVAGDGMHWLPHARLRWYRGGMHSVTVPNGVVYLRRNDKHIWCG